MLRRVGTLWAIGVVALLALASPRANALDENYFVVDDLTFGGTTLNFDTEADGATSIAAPKLFEDATPLTNRYGSLGIRFSSARGGAGGNILHQDSTFGVNARSGANFLAFNREAKTADGSSAREPEVFSFDTPVPNLSLYVAGGFVMEQFRLDAYDAAGDLVDTASASGQDYQQLSVASDKGIARAVLSRDGPRAHSTVSIPNITGAPGGDVTIPIQVDARALAVGGIQLKLVFGDILTIADDSQVSPGPLLAQGISQADLGTAGTVAISGVAARGTDGPGAALLIHGKIRSDATPGTYPLRLTQAELTDTFGETILTDLVDGVLTVGAVTAPTFTSTAVVSPAGPLAPGADYTITATITDTAGSLDGAIADIEVYNSAGVKVSQQLYDKQTFAPGTTLSFTAALKAPAAEGTYTVDVGVFNSDFSQNPHFHDPATTFVVSNVPAAVCGDFDGNGKVTVGDVVTALQIAVGLKTPTDAQIPAVCGYDIKVSFVVRLLQAAVGLSDPPQPKGAG